MKKAEDFSEWYNEIVERTNLTDKRYPVKGMNVWTPYGWKIMRAIDTQIREELDGTGHDEVCFPLLIPADQFSKEKEHIKGFDAEVFWVTHAGLNPLDVKLLLRPTSETAMYPIFALWVRSHADLPLKTYQIVNTFRYETKQTRAFIRVREIHFFESHTCHADFEDAERQVREDYEILDRLAKRWCVPYRLLRRTDWDKFPGADYTVGIDTVLPNGRTLQLGSIHQYRENFSKPYGIEYEDEDGEHRHVHQTTYGMSERLLGAMVAVHGDDKGLLLPPDVAPVQVVVVPVLAKGASEEVNRAAAELQDDVKRAGVRVFLDDRDVRPGAKYYDWELKGVPLRLEIGRKDMEKGVVTYVRRDTGEKSLKNRAEVAQDVLQTLVDISTEMLSRAQQRMEDDTVDAESLDDLPEKLIRLGWCGDEECGHVIEDRTDRNIIGIPVEDEGFDGTCVVCGKKASSPVYIARAM
ncbi:MAG: proline--tRNA ligase [Methanobacteriota archaeon]|nr:MAG: proline--tRNA ligase [Euryarchaeota archaeon]